ncbi:hypothetical protein ACW73L_07560 [Methylolobus aquaticus]
MPLYKATTGISESWHAARQIIIDNPHNGRGQATFAEVQRVAVDGVLLAEKPTGRELVLTIDPLEPRLIPVVDPETDEPVPDQFVTDHEVAHMLRCVYLALAREIDEAGGAE